MVWWWRWREGPYYRSSLGSMALHIGLVLVLSVNFWFSPTPMLTQMMSSEQPDIIHATAITEQQYNQELKTVAQKQEVAKQEAVQQKAEEQKLAEQEKIQAQKKIEEQKIAEQKLAEQKIVEQKKAEEKLVYEQQLEAEKVQKEKLEQEKIAEQKKIEEQKIVEQKKIEEQKLAEQKKLEQEKAAAEAERKKAEAEKLAAQQKAEQQAKEEQLRQQQLLAEQQAAAKQQQLAAQQQAQIASELSRYQALIQQKISSVWMVPLGATGEQTVQLSVRLAPDGSVLSVQVTRSSGNAALDQSAHAAVLKASPLPVPTDFAVFNEMRELDIILTPQV